MTDTKQKNDGTWNVITDKGNINSEIVINAGGLWAREVGKLAGINLPVQPMEHHYLITEAIPEIEKMAQAAPNEAIPNMDEVIKQWLAARQIGGQVGNTVARVKQ